MKISSKLLIASVLFPLVANAEELNIENAVPTENPIENASSLKANIKRLALEYLNHSVSNKNDPNYPDSYNSNEETTIGGSFDGDLIYENSTMAWTNGLTAKYSKNETTENNIKTKDENDDEILLYTDYTRKMWHLEQGSVGPFAYLGYETEFTDFDIDDKSYRTSILRAKTGIKLYDGKYFKQLYVAFVEENDMTYDNNNMKSGSEIGYEFNYPINETTKFVSDGFYRQFFSYSERENTDFKYKVELNNRIETKLTGDLYLAPFYNYELAETRGARSSRAQSTMGLSLTYNNSFDLK